jgi:hypothetical protein
LLAAPVALTLFAAAAHAAPQTFVAVDYEVASDASGCPDADEFRAAVTRQLGFDPFRPSADRRVGVHIARKDTGFEGGIKWTDAQGRSVGDRHFTSRRPECREIAASIAFSVAVQIQLLSTLAPGPPAPATPPSPPPPPPSPPPPPPSPPPPTPPPSDASVTAPASPDEPAALVPVPAPSARRLTLAIGAGPVLAIGVAPQATGLARVFVSSRVAWFSLELGLDAALRTTRQAADGSSFSLDRYAVGAAACAHARMFAGCLTATGGFLQARGGGVDIPASPTGWFSQAGARIAATGELGRRWFVSARVDGLVMLSSWTVALNDVAAWTTPRVSVLAGVDVGVRFF